LTATRPIAFELGPLPIIIAPRLAGVVAVLGRLFAAVRSEHVGGLSLARAARRLPPGDLALDLVYSCLQSFVHC